jgi:hypothetical protein
MRTNFNEIFAIVFDHWHYKELESQDEYCYHFSVNNVLVSNVERLTVLPNKGKRLNF